MSIFVFRGKTAELEKGFQKYDAMAVIPFCANKMTKRDVIIENVVAGNEPKLGMPEVAKIIDEQHAREPDGWCKTRLLAAKLEPVRKAGNISEPAKTAKISAPRDFFLCPRDAYCSFLECFIAENAAESHLSCKTQLWHSQRMNF